jgi:hypothetical protein
MVWVYRTFHQPTILSASEFASPLIEGKYFRLSELADNHHVIEGRTFQDCWIFGPAVIFPAEKIDLYSNWFDTSLDQSFNVTEGVGAGAIVLRDCKFTRCHFVGVSFIGSARLKQLFINDVNREQEHRAE